MEPKPRIFLEEFRLKPSAQDYGLSDEPWSRKKFKKKFRIVIVRKDDIEMEFDLIGIHSAFANAFRRLMLSEVPSMAIEKVMISNNTSLLQDEVLAHRLGLIPLKADPRLFEYPTEESTEHNENDSLEYTIKVKCTFNNVSTKNSNRLEDLYNNRNVYSSHILWHPIGNQSNIYKESSVEPVNSDILIAKMRPGHEIDIHMVAVKGIGKDHAKFSPVATASYRLLPEIHLKREVSGEDAVLLQKCFSPGVIDINKEGKAVVKDARYDSCSRNVLRHDNLKDAVVLSRVRDHFIFNVESVGAMKPEVIFIESVKVLKNKCRTLLEELSTDYKGFN